MRRSEPTFWIEKIQISTKLKNIILLKENKMTREEIAKVELDKAYERLLKNTGLTKRIEKAKDAKKE